MRVSEIRRLHTATEVLPPTQSEIRNLSNKRTLTNRVFCCVKKTLGRKLNAECVLVIVIVDVFWRVMIGIPPASYSLASTNFLSPWPNLTPVSGY